MPKTPKDKLATLARAAPSGIVTAEVAGAAWGTPPRSASRRLATLARSGWLRRVRKGTYQILPLDAISSIETPYEDPWTLATTVFEPCYIGGWSAAEHWGLTEQLFRDTLVVTAAHVRDTEAIVAGLAFRLARVAPRRAVGDAFVWRGATRVGCSSAERTLVDGANSPAWVGGVRHLAEMLVRYAEGPKPNLEGFTRTLADWGRGAGAKRLGFLAEHLARGERNADARAVLLAVRYEALKYRSTGVVKLEPAIRSRGRMNTAWGLWLNADVSRGDLA
jgi:predicted transcriptional regulator of viral defense system